MRRAALLLAALLLLAPVAAAQQGPSGAWRGPLNVSSALVVAGAPVTATLTGQTNLLSMLTGFEFTVANTNASATCSSFTITGLTGGTMTYAYCAPPTGQAVLSVQFTTPIPASGLGVNIVGATAANLATGYTGALAMHGYLLQ